MSEASALFARMFVIGIAVAAPVGAMGVLCIQRVLSHGWRAGAATGAGIATADALYAGLAAFGLTVFSQLLVSAQVPLRIVGGLVLIWLGWRAIVAPPSHEAARAQGIMARLGALLERVRTDAHESDDDHGVRRGIRGSGPRRPGDRFLGGRGHARGGAGLAVMVAGPEHRGRADATRSQ